MANEYKRYVMKVMRLVLYFFHLTFTYKSTLFPSK